MPTSSFDEMTESIRSLRDAFLRMGIDLLDECCYKTVVEEVDELRITENELMAFLDNA